ncbi:MAG TPA: flippase [Candidatus Acidoferrales bacterium]|nr:flippase [Candidatus Acidoferrales bacterium]
MAVLARIASVLDPVGTPDRVMSGQVALFRHIFTLGVAQLVSLVGAVVVTILMPRYLGDVNLGKLAYAGALTSLFGLVADLGTMTYLTKHVARDSTDAGRLTVAALLTRIPLGVGAALLTIAVVYLGGDDEITRAIVFVTAIAMILQSLANTLGAALQGLQRMRALAVSMVLGKVVYAVLVAALLLAGFGPVEVALASLFSSVVGIGVGAIAIRDLVLRARGIRLDTVRQVMFGGVPFFVWQASLVVYGQIDFVLLAQLTNDAVVGWYAAAYRIIMIPAFFPTTVVTAAFPALAAAAKDPDTFAGIARRCIQVLALTTIPMAFGILVLANRIVDLFGYPAVFVNSVGPIVLLSLHMPLAGIDTVLGTMLTALDRQRSWAITGIAAAIINPALNLIAIPFTQTVFANGALGAAAMTTVTEVFMCCVGLALLPRGIIDRRTYLYVARSFAAAAVMAVIVAMLDGGGLGLQIGAGIVTYAVAAVALRIVSPQELREVGRFVLRRSTVTAPLPTENAAG